jgi:hypothetical protein
MMRDLYDIWVELALNERIRREWLVSVFQSEESAPRIRRCLGCGKPLAEDPTEHGDG